ncbi:MAG: radical SAM protein [Myxococcales bacterium]|nr:radical SAM protein [Myxococcales bacterium]
MPNDETTVMINPSFHLQAGCHERDDPAYKAYRARWHKNPANNVVERFPVHLDIETTSACNLRCPMCFQAQADTRPDYGFMRWDLFTRLIDEGSEKGLASIKLQYRGEPLLSDNLEEMVAYAKQKGVIEVMFNTNATLLDSKRARALIDAGLDKIICSVDGHTPEVYNPIRVFPKRPGDFDLVLRNIQGLRRLREELGSAHPLIRVQMVDMPENHAYVQEYTDFWMQNGADAVAIEEKLDYFGEFVRLSLSRAEADRAIYPEFQCEQPWQRLFVLWNGKVTMCCGDHYHRLPLGQLFMPDEQEELTAQLAHARTRGAAETRDGLLEVTPATRMREVRKLVGRLDSHDELSLVGVRDEYDNLVQARATIEEIWSGETLQRVRHAHRGGRSHEISVCASCSLRDAAHRNYNKQNGNPDDATQKVPA